MSLNGTWIDHFPDSFQWSNATLIAKGMAPYGAVALEEIDRIGEKLKARMGEPDAWWQEWSAMASLIEQTADKAVAEGRQATAGNYYIRAGNYYFTGERFIAPGEQKYAMYRKALRCFHAGFERRYPNIERVDVPYEGASLAAYFMKAPGVSGPAPTVVLFDGLDNCKEMSVLFCGLEFAKRGWHTLAIDGPGQGESLRLRKIHTRYDYEVAGTAAYNYVTSRPDVDPKKIPVMGYSFGGYYAPRIVAFEKRYAACVAFGAMHWSIHDWVNTIKKVTQVDAKKSAQSAFQVPWVFGAKDLDSALEMSKHFDLTGVAGKIECPLLVMHGENDRIVPLDSAQKLYDAAGSKRKTLKIFTTEEGGAEHCQVDNRQVGVDYIADWFAANI
jgi:dienelactone hydrolase